MAPTTTDAFLAFAVAAAVAWLLVPHAERLAFRIGAIDPPKERGLHDRPMPRLSRLAIFAGIAIAGWIWRPSAGEGRAGGLRGNRDRRLDLAPGRGREPVDPARRRGRGCGRRDRRRPRPAGAAE